MMNWRELPALAAITISPVLLPVQSAQAQNAPVLADPQTMPSSTSADWRENYAYAVGSQAVIYGYPAVKALNKGNWLPTPRGPFNLFLRGYLPGEALIKQDYVPPAVAKVE